jgi:dihydrofolate reductase
MRKIINSTYISLDGVVENPHHWPSSGDDAGEGDALQTELLFGCDAVLMGRRTYESFAPVWQSRSGDPYSDRINSMDKYVVSSTRSEPDWANTTVINGDPVAELKRLKQAPGKDIVQYGFGRLSFALMENSLLDELRLWVHPLFVGRAEPEDLLYRDCPTATFDLVDSRVLKNGIAILIYRYARTDVSAERSPQ